MTSEYELLQKIVPPRIKEAIARGEYTKIAKAVTGLDDFSFETVTRTLGEKIAMRNNKWRKISNGLLALNSLAKDN